MAHGRQSRGFIWDTLDRLTTLGLQVGGGAFALVSIYLLWGLITGSLANAATLPQADRFRVLQNIQLACKILSISGIVGVASAAIRYYLDEITGYALLIGGAVFHWGIPMLVGTSLQGVSLQAAQLPAYVVSQYSQVGMVSLMLAGPLIAMDFWYKMRGVHRKASRGAAVVVPDSEIPKARLYFFCWQMPYCRDYLRKFCTAYEKKKSCWRLKSGCYCDEEMILRVMKRSATSKLDGFDQRYSLPDTKKKLTATQKRRRCRECFIYTEHQKLKYRIMSPLVFPAAIVIIWMYFKPVKALLHGALELTDKFAGRISFGSGPVPEMGVKIGTTAAASNTVEWLFLICLGMILVTYLLRGLEYFIFDLQV